jgi:hypothetical protein
MPKGDTKPMKTGVAQQPLSLAERVRLFFRQTGNSPAQFDALEITNLDQLSCVFVALSMDEMLMVVAMDKGLKQAVIYSVARYDIRMIALIPSAISRVILFPNHLNTSLYGHFTNKSAN